MSGTTYRFKASLCAVYGLQSCLGISFTAVRLFATKPFKLKKERAEGHTVKKFIDHCKVRVTGGQGGAGVVSFLRAAKDEFAGPDGGNGGCGGHIIFTSTAKTKSLSHIRPVIKAADGVAGRNTHRHGKNADHLYVEVPLGTIVMDSSGQVLTSLEDERDYYIAARGGAGGKGNHHFVSSTETIPQYAEQGGRGEERTLHLEMRMMAHAGLIGFPNAGKSTLLQAISRARPKIAEYPFTTLHPHIGIVTYDDHTQISVADIPGLIEDAHKNRGLGLSFLKHIEQCVCLLYVIDLSIDEPWTQLESLKFELEQFTPGLSQRPHAIIGNKMDLENARDNFLQLQKHTCLPVIPVSAKKRQNVQQLLVHLRKLYDINNGKLL